jgi:hypothetical protein
VYEASFVALPYLAEMAGRRKPAGHVEPLALAAAIIASNDDRGVIAQVRRQYAAELAALRDMAERNLALADDPAEFVYALQALLAFDDVPVWQRELEGLVGGEFEFDCPSCGDQVLLALDGPDDATVAGFASMTDLARPGAGVGARLYAIALEHDQTEVAEQLTYVFGRAICCWCGDGFSVAHAVAAAVGE